MNGSTFIVIVIVIVFLLISCKRREIYGERD
jgi:hypothetical protein